MTSGGQAEPPMTTSLSVESFLFSLRRCCEQAEPDGRHGGRHRHLFRLEEVVDRGAVELRARHHHLAPRESGRRARGPRNWRGTSARSATPSRRARASGFPGRSPSSNGGCSSGASRARPSGCRSCPRCSRGPAAVRSSNSFQRKSVVDLAEPVLVGDRVLQPGRRHMSGVGQDDEALDGRQMVGDRFQQRHEGEVGHHDPVFGVVDDPGDLLGKRRGLTV